MELFKVIKNVKVVKGTCSGVGKSDFARKYIEQGSMHEY